MKTEKERDPHKTYLAIVHGHGLKATAYTLARYPGEPRGGRCDRILGEFATREEALQMVWMHMKRVSAGLKAWKGCRKKTA